MAREDIMARAYATANFRERYALEHYDTKETKKVNGRKLWIFRYSPSNPYQDANGATYDIKKGAWV